MGINKKVFNYLIITLAVFFVTILSLSLSAFASSDVIDSIEIEIPVSCSFSSTGNSSHTATINNGTYAEDIGTTVMKVYCNDANGFSIYAAGYTGEEVGGTNSTKLVGSGTNIITGTSKTGNTSQWAMKLSTVTDPVPTYPITILSDTNGPFSDYHIVPESYVKVATRLSSTDIGAAAVGSTLTSTYQVYISPTESSGAYAGKVIYTLVHPNNEQPPAYMQDQTTASLAALMPENGNSTVLYDKRDDSRYTIKKINNQYWMTQNLRITGTISAEESNFSSVSEFNVSEYSSDINDSSYTNHCDSTNSRIYACAKDSGNATIGVWYNFYSATAGTISGSSSSTLATEDICPAGWHLPSGPNTLSGSDINNLVGNATSGEQDSTAGITAFNPVVGGYYTGGSLGNTTDYARWWTTRSYSSGNRYALYYDSSTDRFNGTAFNSRAFSIFIRCVHD